MRPSRLTTAILCAIVLGIAAGWLAHLLIPAAADRRAVADALSVATDLFLRLVKMVIAPLVFTTLLLGIAKMDDARAMGRIGAKTLVWFFSASLISIALGAVMADALHPGRGLHLTAGPAGASTVAPFDARSFVVDLVPQSIVQAMAENAVLQIVVFALFAGTAALALGERVDPLIKMVEGVAAIMLKVTGYVMLVAPLAVFAALASTIAVQGPDILFALARFVGGFYLSLFLFTSLLLAAAALLLRGRTVAFLRAVREPLLVGFATASSEAAYPRLLAQIEGFGIPNRIASFVLPLGYSFNMDGAMMYCSFAVLFVAQAYGIELTWAQKLPMLLLLMVSTKGLAGVPRASLVIITSTLQTFHLPQAGLVLILAVDHVLDMGRTGVNVLGNSVAACAVARWEGETASLDLAGRMRPDD